MKSDWIGPGIGVKVICIKFFKNCYGNSDLYEATELRSAVNHDNFAKNWCLKIEPLRENRKCYRNSNLIFWKPRKFPAKAIEPDFRLLIVFRVKISFENTKISKFSSFSPLFTSAFGNAWINRDPCWWTIDTRIGSGVIVEWRVIYHIMIWIVNESMTMIN